MPGEQKIDQIDQEESERDQAGDLDGDDTTPTVDASEPATTALSEPGKPLEAQTTPQATPEPAVTPEVVDQKLSEETTYEAARLKATESKAKLDYELAQLKVKESEAQLEIAQGESMKALREKVSAQKALTSAQAGNGLAFFRAEKDAAKAKLAQASANFEQKKKNYKTKNAALEKAISIVNVDAAHAEELRLLVSNPMPNQTSTQSLSYRMSSATQRLSSFSQTLTPSDSVPRVLPESTPTTLLLADTPAVCATEKISVTDEDWNKIKKEIKSGTSLLEKFKMSDDDNTIHLNRSKIDIKRNEHGVQVSTTANPLDQKALVKNYKIAAGILKQTTCVISSSPSAENTAKLILALTKEPYIKPVITDDNILNALKNSTHKDCIKAYQKLEIPEPDANNAPVPPRKSSTPR